jgi:hypothetical protein
LHQPLALSSPLAQDRVCHCTASTGLDTTEDHIRQYGQLRPQQQAPLLQHHLLGQTHHMAHAPQSMQHAQQWSAPAVARNGASAPRPVPSRSRSQAQQGEVQPQTRLQTQIQLSTSRSPASSKASVSPACTVSIGMTGGHANGTCNGTNPKFVLSLDKVRSGIDVRTALMIRNIPNKYSQKMLLSALEESHRGHFDFMYLPIDFKNKCNVGYAFINFVQPQYIVSFYHEFHGRKWGKFNSEKVCEITYARIQGKQQLISHFQNSSLMNEDPKCRPVVFGQDGKQEEFPVGSNVRTRRGPSARETRPVDGTNPGGSPVFSPVKQRGRCN